MPDHVMMGVLLSCDRSKDGFKINADCNGAANILRKVAAKLGFNLDGVSRGALIAPLKVRIWAVQESPSL
jgi:transposase